MLRTALLKVELNPPILTAKEAAILVSVWYAVAMECTSTSDSYHSRHAWNVTVWGNC